MASATEHLNALRRLADSVKVDLIASLLSAHQPAVGIRVSPGQHGAQRAHQVEIDLGALGSVLQHADLLGPSFHWSTIADLQRLFRTHASGVRPVSRPLWGDGGRKSCFVLGSATAQHEIGSMISAKERVRERERE